MKHWFIPSLKQHVITEDGQVPADCGYSGKQAIELDREPGEFDSFNSETSSLTFDKEAEANAKAGIEHIIEARLAKYCEALLVKAGVELTTGLLVQESKQQNITIDKLASAVVAKRRSFLATEKKRQAVQFEQKDNPDA